MTLEKNRSKKEKLLLFYFVKKGFFIFSKLNASFNKKITSFTVSQQPLKNIFNIYTESKTNTVLPIL